MKATIVSCPYGLLAIGERRNLIDKVLFSKQLELAAAAYIRMNSGRLDKDFILLLERLVGHGYVAFVFNNRSLAEEVRSKLDVAVEVDESVESVETLRSDVKRFAVETGFVSDTAELEKWTQEVTVEIAKIKVRQSLQKRDPAIINAIQALDDLDKTINLFVGRVREWYGTSFPELDSLLENHETYTRLVLKLGDKTNFTREELERENLPKQKAGRIAEMAVASMGAEISDRDLTQIRILCELILDLYSKRYNLERYLDEAMNEFAPNVRSIAGSLLGARLIGSSGSLISLAKMPASTIQVLGAEKALFRSLKTGTRPPKHGLIFQHALLHEAKHWNRGKVARALAGKLAIAARSDAFGTRYIGEDLKANLHRRITEIQEKYSEAPKIKEKRSKRGKGGRRRRARRS